MKQLFDFIEQQVYFYFDEQQVYFVLSNFPPNCIEQHFTVMKQLLKFTEQQVYFDEQNFKFK